MGRLRRKRSDGVRRDARSTFAYAPYQARGSPATYPNILARPAGTRHPDDAALAVDAQEENVLGAVTDKDTWLARIAEGRGATVCTPAVLRAIAPLELDDAPPSFHASLEWPSGEVLPVWFAGRAVSALHSALFPHAEAGGAVLVFLSGFGGEVVSVAGEGHLMAGAEFVAERVSLKALLVSASAACLLWFDCNRGAPVKLVMRPVERGAHSEPPAAPVAPAAPDAPDAPQATPPATPSVTPPPPPAATSRMLGSRAYVCLDDVIEGTVISTMGVSLNETDPRMPGGRSRDYMQRLILGDGSGAGRDASLLINMFAASEAGLPGRLARYEALIIRGLQITSFNARHQGVLSRRFAHDWAVWNSTANTWRYAPGSSDAFSDVERCALMQLVERMGVLGRTRMPSAPRAEPTRLADVEPHKYVRLVCEIVKVFPHSAPPDIYVTDYSRNMRFFAQHERFLRGGGGGGGGGGAGAGGAVFQIGLWDSQAPRALELRPGDIVRLENVRIKEGRTGVLSGALGNLRDYGTKIHVLDDADPDFHALVRWRDAFTRKRPATEAGADGYPPRAVAAPRFNLDDDLSDDSVLTQTW